MEYAEFKIHEDKRWEDARRKLQRQHAKAYNQGLFEALFSNFRLDLYLLLRRNAN